MSYSGPDRSYDGLRETLEAVHNAGGLVIGSIGRSAIFGEMDLDPLLEFKTRGEELLVKKDGTLRDVDVIGEYGFTRSLPKLPHLVDGTAFNRLRTIAKGKDGWSYIDFENVSHTLDQACFEPVEGKLGEIPCRTVRPATHMVLRSSRIGIGHLLMWKYIPPEERAFLDSGVYGPLWSKRTAQLLTTRLEEQGWS